VNLLLLNHYAGTPELGMEYRPYYLAREWVRLGHRVRIVAADFSHVRTRQPPPGTQVIDGIEYQWLPTPAYRGNGVGRLRNVMAYLSQTWAMADELARDVRPDAVIASSTYPMDNWVARRIAQAAARAGVRARHVYELHDLWPLSLIELAGMSPWHPFALVCQSAEDAAYRHCDLVVSMLPKVHPHVTARGLDLRKLAIVPNGISPEEWQGAPAPLRGDVAAALAAAREGERVVVGYAGSMGLPNALDHLLDAAKRLADAPLGFVLVGDGHERERLARRIADEGLSRVALLPPIPKAQVRAFLAAIDIAFIGWQRVPIYRFGIAPNKLMDYMMAGKAVLHAVEAGNDPVGDARCGLTVPPEDPAAIAEGLKGLAGLRAADRRAMGERGKAYVLRHHAYPVLAQRFIAALGGC
jgi:glycosyltransferase involved in cell wall biosynthesis